MANEVYTSGVQFISPGGRIYLNPGANREMTIHNISVSQPATLEVYDVDQDEVVTVDTITEDAGGSWMGMFLHCTEKCHYCIWNNGDSTMGVTANGRYSK